ncbi:MAG: hypothetical protein AAFW82_09620 [Pseudomonadota bacterium]
MLDKHRQRRGRPKGSGIDDRSRLLAIAEAMERDPQLRVTTAIKQLGFDDPSTIRRLRDKFKANHEALLQPLHAASYGSLTLNGQTAHTRTSHARKVNSRLHKAEAGKKSAGSDIPKNRCFKRAQDALAEYAHLADRPVSFVSGFQASIAHCLLQQTQDQGLEYCI